MSYIASGGCRNSSVVQTHNFISCPGGWSQTILQVKNDGHSCSQHANSTLPQNLRHLWHCLVWKLHIRECLFIFPSTRCTCVMSMLFKLASLYATPGRWMDYLGKGEMLTKQGCKQISSQWQKTFVHMEHYWDLLLQLVKHEANTLHVAFIFLLSCMCVVSLSK